MSTEIPKLEHGCGSWICTSPSGNIREFYKRSTVVNAAKQGWKIQTAMQYLCELNQKLQQR